MTESAGGSTVRIITDESAQIYICAVWSLEQMFNNVGPEPLSDPAALGCLIGTAIVAYPLTAIVALSIVIAAK